MGKVNHLSGVGAFWSDDERVNHLKLWSRLEFERGPGWAKVTIGSLLPDEEPEVSIWTFPMVVLIIGMIMDLILEYGGADVDIIRPRWESCPYDCDHGYVKEAGGNYYPCPHCGGGEE